ncbi:YggT family protein [Cutibacterium equinum]|uniref:YggT family protein n=1 Tax=Cutibacterium equinum TaxID=3016342 RepID=A0ABY7R203_9ACTN|nr:YggT family protein [Cutibacterium equinum]WCC80582.1 YggT family protein [Cutibacterium equinum]
MILAGTILAWLIHIYTMLLIVRMIMSWVPLLVPGFEPHGVLAVIFEIVYTITDPPIRFFDRLVPPLRFGSVGFSVGFIIVFVLLALLQRLVVAVFF